MDFLRDPFISGAIMSTIVPLVASFAIVGILGLLAGPSGAGAAIAAAFLVSYYLILGMPAFPPVSATQKIAYLALLGLALGVALDIAGPRRWLGWSAIVLYPAAVVGWLGWTVLTSGGTGLAALAILWIAGVLVFERLFALRGAAIASPTMLLAAAFGASLVAFIGAASSFSQLLAACTAGAGGFLLWNWPKVRFPFSAGAIFGGGGAFYAVAASSVLFSDSAKAASALILLVFAVGFLHPRMNTAARPVSGPILFGLVCAIPAVAAILIAYWSGRASLTDF